jgi:ubiquinone biosynthesis protein
MADQVGARAMLRSLREDLPYLVEKLPEMPGLIYNASKRLAEGDDFERIRDDMQLMREQMARNNKRTVLGIVATGLIMSALLLLGMADASSSLVFGLPMSSWISGGAGILVLVYVLYSLE